MSLQLCKLGNLGGFRNGLNYSKGNFGHGLKVISVKDFGDRWRPDLAGLDEIDPAGVRAAQFDLQRGDILFVRSNGNRDLIGRSMLIEEDLEDVSFSGFCIRFRPTEAEVDSRFLSLYFRTPLFRRTLSLQGKGTNINNLNQTILGRMDVPWPARIVQERIVDTAGAYDDLIDNNQRRIALLEEAARLLYREWFVHFRFPGHKHLKIIDGLPEGWERRTLGSVLNLQRGFDLPINRRVAGGVPVYGSTGIVGEHNVTKVDSPTLITGRSGSLGRVCFVDDPCWPLNTSLWVTDFKAVSIYFAYFMLSEMDLAKFNAGASVPTLDRKVAHATNVLVPTRNIATLFDEQMEVVFMQKKLLDQQIQKLVQARDLLLPRLMNGEIAV